jgi:thymidylate synthase (FAD)
MVIIKAPEFVLRQWYKHVVGIETTSTHATKDHAWNEISGRYVEVEDFYYPDVWRKQSEDNKQASEGELDDLQQKRMSLAYKTYMNQVEMVYDHMISSGVAKEQARIVLPLSQYTQVWWTASFQSVMNFIELRDEPTAQVEIQEYARALKKIMLDAFPETTKLWSETYW